MTIRATHYRIFGEGDAIVLIPGLDGLTDFFADVVPDLSRRFRVIVYELPLKGDADHADSTYSFDYIAADLKRVLHELKIAHAHVVGESFGGVVAQVFALTYPESTDTLTLISSAPHFDLSLKNRLLLPTLRFVPMWLFARFHLHDVCEPGDPTWAKRRFVQGASQADRPSVFARARIAAQVDLRDRIAAIKVPVLLIMGSADRFTGQASRAMKTLLPDAKLVQIEGGGHLCHMTHPQAFLEALMSFLPASRDSLAQTATG